MILHRVAFHIQRYFTSFRIYVKIDKNIGQNHLLWNSLDLSNNTFHSVERGEVR